MNEPNNIYTDGVEVLSPCVYTASNAADAINNLTQDTYEASGNAWDAYGTGKNHVISDSFMDDIAEVFED